MACPLPPGHPAGNGVQDYNKGCRCPAAVTANSEYRARRRRLIAYGRATEETHTDAALVVRHIRKLKRAGMSYTRIAAHAGVSHTVVEELVTGARSKIRPTTMSKLLRVQPAPADLADQGYVNATGTARRLQALAVLGYSPNSIGRRAGLPSSSTARVVSGHHKMLRADHAAAVARIYDELWDKPFTPTTDREAASRTWTVRNAQNHGWFPPLVWDDDRIDDPAYRPRGAGLRRDDEEETAA